ncbi:outer membrane beta-barrel protein [Chitinimonas arctica]|uniref:Outer membrane beta-barrel protein n=1 Tax=Chitinimonas arctica TaxID=2594795 RepID=A0A516SAH5_9NEIS|nr:porin family protein [Chitinimonas arctica]QDQ25154.1 outer membrane beta-barrel protein [Chitinimonas arctica]
MKKQFPLLALAVLLVAPAFAEGFYAGADLGRSKLSFLDKRGMEQDTHVNGYTLFGGYRFNENLALEGSYRNQADVIFDYFDTRYEFSHFGLSVLAGLPLSPKFDVYGRLGYGRSKWEHGSKASGHQDEAIYGVGGRYAISQQFGVRAELSRLDKSEIDMLTVGVDYRF